MEDLIAVKPQTYAGKHLKPGDPFRARSADAKVLTITGLAKPDIVSMIDTRPRSREPIVDAPPPTDTPPTDSQTPSPEPVVDEPTHEQEPVHHGSRRYKRRDMRAE